MANRPEALLSCLREDLQEQGLPSSGDPHLECEPRRAAAASLAKSLLRKLDRGRTRETDQAALSKFLSINSDCENWSPAGMDDVTRVLIGHLKQVVDKFWFRRSQYFGSEPLFDHPFDLLARGRFGPGANIGADGGDFYTKLFSSKITGTSQSLYTWYRRYTTSFPEWSNAELIRQAHFGDFSVVDGNKLSFVPKNDEISRVICIEPILNTYFQLGICHILESRLREQFGIALQNQQFENRRLAHQGSLSNDLSTIDLSSASDSMSLKMLEFVLPAGFFRQLVKYRSPVSHIKGVGSITLNMVSTMGNGYTFPLQTMLFAAVVAACYEFQGLNWNQGGTEKTWGVNGDDIIVPRIITENVIKLLTFLGFKVNSDKTFTEGPFRESCGADFFLGVNIRGVYIKHLDDRAAIYTAINRLIRFSVRNRISLNRCIKYLTSLLGGQAHYVPAFENLDSGIHVPESFIHGRGQWNKKQYTFVYRVLLYRAPAIEFADGYVICPRGNKRRAYNPPGLLVSLLQGGIYNSKSGTRFGPGKWIEKRRFTSSWNDHTSSVPWSYDYGIDWARWNTECTLMLKS